MSWGFILHSGIAVLALVFVILLIGSWRTDREPEPLQAGFEPWNWRLDPSLQVRRDVSRHARNLDFPGYLAKLDSHVRSTDELAQE